MEIYTQLLAVVVVLALLAGAMWLIRRVGGVRVPRTASGEAKTLELAGKVGLGPQQTLFLVRFGDRALVVASHSGGCTLIESRPWSEVRDPVSTGQGGAG